MDIDKVNPYNPARHPKVDTSNRARSSQKQERLYNLLQRMEEEVQDGELDPTDVLRQTLQAISDLESKTVEFKSPSDAPYNVLARNIREYLKQSGNGERLPAVVAGIMQTYYEHAGEGDWQVDCEHANVSDEFSKAAGDVEIFYHGELQKAMEVKDKPATRSSVQFSTLLRKVGGTNSESICTSLVRDSSPAKKTVPVKNPKKHLSNSFSSLPTSLLLL